MRGRFKWRFILSGVYLAVYTAAAALAMYGLVTDTANSEFSGLGLILVTYPCSVAWSDVIEKLGILAWYDQFAGHPALYGFLASIAMLPAAIPYTAMLYFIGKRLERSRDFHKASPRITHRNDQG